MSGPNPCRPTGLPARRSPAFPSTRTGPRCSPQSFRSAYRLPATSPAPANPLHTRTPPLPMPSEHTSSNLPRLYLPVRTGGVEICVRSVSRQHVLRVNTPNLHATDSTTVPHSLRARCVTDGLDRLKGRTAVPRRKRKTAPHPVTISTNAELPEPMNPARTPMRRACRDVRS